MFILLKNSFFVTLNELKDAPGNRHTIKKGMTMPLVRQVVSKPFNGKHKVKCLERYIVRSFCIQSAILYLRNF